MSELRVPMHPHPPALCTSSDLFCTWLRPMRPCASNRLSCSHTSRSFSTLRSGLVLGQEPVASPASHQPLALHQVELKPHQQALEQPVTLTERDKLPCDQQ
eukprot:GHRQ01034618.1.p2 GENE.GHRQ01034618.1~~GHRQ01034618.1.p2  ORF type:complete len:101 (+),score=4.51 GHRQ01034618.1:696-998(+)